MPSRHNLSRAQQLFSGSANLSQYEFNKNGVELTPLFRWRPAGVRAVTFSGALAAGVISATLSGAWGGASGLYPMTLSSGEVVSALLVNGATTCTFWPATASPTGGTYGPAHGILNAVTSAATVAGQPPVLGVANLLSVSAAIGVAGLAVLTTNLIDVPRNIVGAWTTNSIVTVTGTDYWGQAQTEVGASAATFTGKKAFATVTSILSSASITGATFGTGNVLGLPFRVSSGDVAGLMFNDAADAGTFLVPDLTNPATGATGDVRGTYAPAGTLNGAKFVAVLLKVTDRTTQVGAFGVTPA
jgi:hypothetical protein